MGQRIFKKVQAPEGVAPGQTATVRFAIGSKYHEIAMVTNMALADMTEIRLIANNKTIHRYSATERDTMNQYYGLPAFGAAKILYIPLDRKALKTRSMEEVTGINTGVTGESGERINALYLEVDIASGATTPTLDVYATTSAATGDGVGTVMHITKHNRNAAGSGELQVSDLPFNRPTAAALNASFIFPSANDISKIVVERGLYKVFERSKALNERMQTIGERVPQGSCHVVDFTENGYGANALDLRGYQDFRYLLTMTGAAQVTFLSEYLGVLGD
ncbi:major capsid protein P2 [Marinobacter sp. LN3S78]|uniref:major capsid protein P2 n=1 Tax=Marinobacter sp. LN3S78 TaxID=3382300 RepID=UPI00387AF094